MPPITITEPTTIQKQIHATIPATRTSTDAAPNLVPVGY